MSIYEAGKNAHDMLSDDDLSGLIETAVNTNGGITEEDISALADWAHDVKFNAMILDMAIKGQVGIEWGDGEPIFVHPKYAKGPLR